jgi:hypothetical protein
VHDRELKPAYVTLRLVSAVGTPVMRPYHDDVRVPNSGFVEFVRK